jgi:hypothetical protein
MVDHGLQQMVRPPDQPGKERSPQGEPRPALAPSCGSTPNSAHRPHFSHDTVASFDMLPPAKHTAVAESTRVESPGNSDRLPRG